MPAREDVWVPSACSMCYSNCGIMAHREHLMKMDWKCVDWTVHNWDLCVKARVYKA